MIKLRRSFKGGERKPAALSNLLSPKSSLSIEPPKKVIRALYEYEPQSILELAFAKGDFFHVVGNEDDPNWYEACNPATNQRGLVPVSYFQILGRNEKDSRSIDEKISVDSGFADSDGRRLSQAKGNKSTPLYGIVQYDFQAERPDELEAKAGEAIIIIAQSNHEWFVAKPIGRLGGPGLIPVSFIQLRDMATGRPIENVTEIVTKSSVPRVEEWKKAAAEYKNSSISLGKFDFDQQTGDANRCSVSTKRRSSQVPIKLANVSTVPSADIADVFPSKASVDQYFFDKGIYWYLVRAETNDGRHRNLCRYYDDFYELQIALLEAYPTEAGRTGQLRSLPFIPGPLTHVDDHISAQRRSDLHSYIRELCKLPHNISRGILLRSFFSLREGDVESNHYTNVAPHPSVRTSAVVRSSQISQVSSGFANVHQGRTIQSRTSTADSTNSPPGFSMSPKIPRDERLSSGPTFTALDARADPSADAVDLTTLSRTSDRARGNSGTVAPFMKLKICFDEDLIAIRVPLDVTFDQVCERLRIRLPRKFAYVRYRDSPLDQYVDIENESDFRKALEANTKLVLYVQ